MTFWLCFEGILLQTVELARLEARSSWEAVSTMGARDNEYLAGTMVEVMEAVTKWLDPASIYPRLTRCLNGLLVAGREMK